MWRTAWRSLVVLALIASAPALLGAQLLLLGKRPSNDALRIDHAELLTSEAATDRDAQAPTREVRLPHDWRDQDRAQEAWYYFTLRLNVAPERLWSVYIPRAVTGVMMFANGELIGLDGRTENGATRNWNLPLQYTIPNGLLRQGENAFAIRLFPEHERAGFLSEVYLAPHSVLSPYVEQSRFMRATVVNVLVVLMGLSASFIALLWTLRPSDGVYGYCALMMACWTVHNLHQVVPATTLPPVALDVIWHASALAAVLATRMFVLRYLGLRRDDATRRLLACAALIVGLLTAAAAVAPLLLHDWLLPVSDTLALLVAIETLLLMVRFRSPQSRTEHRALLAVAGVGLLFGLHDWAVVVGLHDRSNGYVLVFASIALLLLLGTMMIRRFGAALARLELMNNELEHRVADRERVLSESFRRVSSLERAQAVAAERERMMREVHDGIGSVLISSLAGIERSGDPNGPVADALREAIQELRLIIDSLDPVDGDLTGALAMYRARIGPRLRAAGVALEWAVDDIEPLEWLTPVEILNILRILQEAINNAVKHSGADRIRLAVTQRPAAGGKQRQTRVELIDNGSGFDPSAVAEGRGLSNMRHRAIAAQATLDVRPSENGTCVRLEFSR